MTAKGQTSVKARSILYSFRLWDTDEQKKYQKLLGEWIEERAVQVSKSARLTEIITALIDNWQGEKAPQKDKGVAQLINRRLDRLETMLNDQKQEIMRAIVTNPRMVQQINDASQRYQSGEELSDDLIGNLLEDFDRKE